MDAVFRSNEEGMANASSVDTGTTDNPLEEREVNTALLTAYNILVVVQVALLMLSMGSGVELAEIKRQFIKPKGIILGCFCQLLLMPLLTFAFAHATQLSAELAIGLVVISSCPGGAPANFFSLTIKGDLSLSVCLTVISSALSLATMPLNKFMYIRSWTSQDAVIPYYTIITAVAITWIPAIMGMLFRRRFPQHAPKLTRIGGLAAFIVLLAFAVVQQFVYPGVLRLTWNVWFAALFLPVVGWLVGFGVATMFMFEIPQCRALAYGTSYVNGGIALALITLTFDNNAEANAYILFPMVYTACQVIMSTVIALLHRLYFQLQERNTLCHKLYNRCQEKNRPSNTRQEVIIGISAPPLKLQLQDGAGEKYRMFTDLAGHTVSGLTEDVDQQQQNSVSSAQKDTMSPPPYDQTSSMNDCTDISLHI